MTGKLGQLAFILVLATVPFYVFWDIATRFAEKSVDTGSAGNNAAMYPRLIALIMVALLIIQAARTVTMPAEGPASAPLGTMIRTHARAIAVFALFLAYISAFRWFGFVYSTPVFLFLTQLVLGYRQPAGLIAYPFGVTAAVYYAFAKILNLALPAGDLFS